MHTPTYTEGCASVEAKAFIYKALGKPASCSTALWAARILAQVSGSFKRCRLTCHARSAILLLYRVTRDPSDSAMTLVYLAAAWTVGIALARAIHPPWQVIPPLALLFFLVLLLWRDDRRVRMGALCVLVLLLGAGRFLLAVPRFAESSLATYNGVGWVTVDGVVVGEPDERDNYTGLRLRSERLALPDGTERQVTGLVLVRAGRYPRRHYGDSLRVQGLLDTPPVFEGFSYRDYLARSGIHSIISPAQVLLLAENQANPLWYHLYAFKRRAQETIAAILPEPQAALLTGILLGVETGIPQDVQDDFEATGTTHIIAISGFNNTLSQTAPLRSRLVLLLSLLDRWRRASLSHRVRGRSLAAFRGCVRGHGLAGL